MAIRGAKPKAAALRVVDGTTNVTRHGPESEQREKAEKSRESFGGLTKPTNLRGSAAKAWKKYIEPASWLDASREPSAIRFCQLWDESQAAPQMFTAAKDGQMRAYMSELGLTDERNRAGQKEEAKDEFFD